MQLIWVLLFSAVAFSGCPFGNEAGMPDGPPVGSSGPSAPDLTALSAGQAPALEGELGCSFTATGSETPSLLAKAWVGDEGVSDGVVALDGSPVKLTGTHPGGFNRLAREAGSFTGAGVSVSVVVAGDAGSVDAGQIARKAILTINVYTGAARVEAGTWICSPQGASRTSLFLR